MQNDLLIVLLEPRQEHLSVVFAGGIQNRFDSDQPCRAFLGRIILARDQPL